MYHLSAWLRNWSVNPVQFLVAISACINFLDVYGFQVSNLSTIENFKPGDKKQVQIKLINDRDVVENVDLKLTNFSCNSDGQCFFDDLCETSKKYSRSNAAWMTLGQQRISLAPGETRTWFYSIEVPQNNS